MNLDMTDKIILTSTAVIALSSISMLMMAKKYEKRADDIDFWMMNIRSSVNAANIKIVDNNRAILDGNRMLREILANQLKEVNNGK